MNGKPRAPRVDLRITEELIEDSKQRDSSHCMIAEAVKAAFPTAKHVSVDLQTIRFTDPTRGLRYTYLTPRIAQVGLVNFDAGVAPDPFTFSLRGGQVTSAGASSLRRIRQQMRAESGQPLTEAQLEASRNMAAKGRLSKQTLVFRDGIDAGSDLIPEVVGGQTPPLGKVKPETPGQKAVAFTRRRQFGLRALER